MEYTPLLAKPTGNKSQVINALALETIEAMPKWFMDITKNPYIKYGYRPIGSLYPFGIHNETMNIYTHFGPAIYAIYLLSYYAQLGSWGIVLQLLVCIHCLLSSSTFHLCLSHSKQVATSCHTWDHCGIALAIGGSILGTAYYTNPSPFYITIVIVLTVAVNAPLQSMHLKSLFYVLQGVSGYFCLQNVQHEVLAWCLLAGILFMIGVSIFIGRWPEKRNGNWFITSHGLFHVCVVGGMFAHHQALLILDFNKLS
jgi:adiponectin receptor